MVSTLNLDDEDDFGGDAPGSQTSTKRSDGKRKFGDLDEEEDGAFGRKGKSKIEESGPGMTMGMILSLRESLQNCKANLTSCQGELEVTKSEIQKWHSAFHNGPVTPAGMSPEPGLVLTYLLNLKSSEESLKEQLEKAKKREAAFIVTFAKREQEIADLKSAVRDLKTQLRPPSMQFSMEGKSKKRLTMVATATNAPTSQPILSTPIEQVESSMPTKVKRKTLCAKHLWTKQEDAALVDCLVELSKDSVWKSENGFRTGYLLHLEELMDVKVPSSNLKATPHIESRYKLLKR
ncbi:FKBP12-interacting protein of 37 kDa-like isoform X1 [Zingiber officinale]|uniref:FKBP12-interacting protein of 37 kDa-like isoform X1 n=1 Tax=Zingiber officinale TaxID=94328 RepID=UPI001C4D0B2B|nr:FKBP12-interacting protein of 37 kDa-like isoform X1 [Zingiber officinale]